jgi:uncharacterized protein YndB with AHSA1/START domain
VGLFFCRDIKNTFIMPTQQASHAALQPLVVEQDYHAPADALWQALTNKDKMREWYFDLEDFRPEVGFDFRFYGGSDEIRYLHLCRVTEAIPGKRLTYSWQYKGYPGESLVSFELFPQDDITRLTLHHAGIHSFPQDSPDFSRESFTRGWTMLLGTNLKNYLEKKSD